MEINFWMKSMFYLNITSLVWMNNIDANVLLQIYSNLRNPVNNDVEEQSNMLVDIYKTQESIILLFQIASSSADEIERLYAITGIVFYVKYHIAQLDQQNIQTLKENLFQLLTQEKSQVNIATIIKIIKNYMKLSKDQWGELIEFIHNIDNIQQEPSLILNLLTHLFSMLPANYIAEHYQFYTEVCYQCLILKDSTLIYPVMAFIKKLFKYCPKIAPNLSQMYQLIADSMLDMVYSLDSNQLKLVYNLYKIILQKGIYIEEVENMFPKIINWLSTDFQNLDLNYLRMVNELISSLAVGEDYNEVLLGFYELEKQITIILFGLNDEDPDLLWITSINTIFTYLMKIFDQNMLNQVMQEYEVLSKSQVAQEQFLSVVLITCALVSLQPIFRVNFIPIYHQLVLLLVNADQYVQYCVCMELDELLKEYPDEITCTFGEIFPIIINSITSNENVSGITLLSNIVKCMTTTDEIDYDEILSYVFKWIDNSNVKVHSSSLSILISLIERSTKKIMHYVNVIMQMVIQHLDNPNFFSANLFFIVSVLIMLIPELLLPYMDNVFDLLDAYLRSFNYIDMNGVIYCVESISESFRNENVLIHYFNLLGDLIIFDGDAELNTMRQSSYLIIIHAMSKLSSKLKKQECTGIVFNYLCPFFQSTNLMIINQCCEIATLLVYQMFDYPEDLPTIIRYFMIVLENVKDKSLTISQGIINTFAVIIRYIGPKILIEDIDILFNLILEIIEKLNSKNCRSENEDTFLFSISRLFRSFGYHSDQNSSKTVEFILQYVLKPYASAHSVRIRSFAYLCLSKMFKFNGVINFLSTEFKNRLLINATLLIKSGGISDAIIGARFITNFCKTRGKEHDIENLQYLISTTYPVIQNRFKSITEQSKTFLRLRDYLLKCLCSLGHNAVIVNMIYEPIIDDMYKASPPRVMTSFTNYILRFLSTVLITDHNRYENIRVFSYLFALPYSQIDNLMNHETGVLLSYANRLYFCLKPFDDKSSVISQVLDDDPYKISFFNENYVKKLLPDVIESLGPVSIDIDDAEMVDLTELPDV